MIATIAFVIGLVVGAPLWLFLGYAAASAPDKPILPGGHDEDDTQDWHA